VVHNVTAGDAPTVIDLLADQREVDWVEVTPTLTFFNKWARGVTQSGDWQLTPLTKSGLNGTGQVGVAMALT
jgi:hypothetical protein